MSFEINKSVKWVGKIDWELQKFHGDEYSTHRGSSYNSFLVRDEKTALIDTVWTPFAKEFVSKLKQEIDLNSIDYIIANHGEPDHSGALPELMREIPNTPIYCTANAIKSLKGQYHQDWNFIPVKTGDKLSLGSKEFIFVEARMLHWPDTMFTYMTGDNILFSNDGFGQHLASEHMFNDLVDQAELYQEALKYYANILTPFSKMVENKINEILSFNLPVDMICPSHGVIWRDNPLQIVDKYMGWAKDYQENQITIIYDTMWNSTRHMAETIAAGIKQSNKTVIVKLFNCNSTHTDKNDIISEVFKSKAIIVGSPTINKGILFSVAGILEMIKGLGFKNKKAVAFGSYGWSGENTKLISSELSKGGFELLNEGLRVTWNPDSDAEASCLELGRSVGEALK
ncbi:anaerobic nitric oxide reductase flavorubredoxin [Desulfosporosinus sp.]|uniref:anaerobic nitric oxide reductase flavorubredoxin n=1 Tax=Desulfosporosinus sp. TaxID=157907 RepID=UPI0025BC7695|nr:anaerobic nitric oxide reductase flavorubredoxin [Desulfosporosinus sp.]MBC2727479.1 anaerobic nitric oxide reductase flavorubredoxin [Desulfosporosinus sp.]